MNTVYQTTTYVSHVLPVANSISQQSQTMTQWRLLQPPLILWLPRGKCRSILTICFKFQCYRRCGSAGYKCTSFWIGHSRHNNVGPRCTFPELYSMPGPSSDINMHQPAIPALPLNQPFTSGLYAIWCKEKITIH